MSLKGKRALVLGGTSGIGLAVAQDLLREQCEVHVASKSAARIEIAQDVLGPEGQVHQVDVLDREQLTELFKKLASIDVLVNSAVPAGRAVGPFPEMDLDGFQAAFNKLWGYVNSVRFGLPHMSPDGNIVVVSGSPARKCPPGLSALSTVGNAVEGFVRAVAPEIHPVRINAVSPGLIDTPLFPQQGQERAEVFEQLVKGRVIPRVGQPEEVSEAVMFLVRNSFVTGTVVDVDGGALLP